MSGTAGTCVAGDCTPNEVQACRGKTAVVCNAAGTNYDLKSCEHGCDPVLGCVGCMTDTECSAAVPHCDATTHECRGCEADAECSSNVCSTTAGTCVDPSTLIYASPTGSSAGGCGTQQMPCDLPTAVAHADAVKSVIKLEKGDYTFTELDLTSNKIATVLGSGSTLRVPASPPGQRIFTVRDGAHLSLQDVTLTSSINCYTNTTFVPEVRLGNVNLPGITADPCTIVATNSTWIAPLPQGGTGINVSTSPSVYSNVSIDRCTFRGAGITATGAGNVVNIVNSVMDGAVTDFGIGLAFEGVTGTIAFSTLVNAVVTCNASASITLANNIMFGTNASDVLYQTGSVCPVHYSLMNPQAMVYTGWDHVLRNVDPLLTSLPNKDFHLLAGSPAIDAADPAAGLSTDIEGTARPQGTRLDLGAFERKP